MNILNDSISIQYFISQINDQLKAGVDTIILSPNGLSVLYPFVRRLNPYLPRAQAEILVKLLPVVDFHANAFDFAMPGRVYIARRRFWEFTHFFESVLDCEYDPSKVPAEYGEGMELIFDAFERLRKLSKSDSVVKENYKLLGGTLCYLIDRRLKDELTTPVYPISQNWRVYQKDNLEVLSGFYNIGRRQTEDGWIYVNLNGSADMIVSESDLDPYMLTCLLTDNTGERIMYRDHSERNKFKILNSTLFGEFDPWNKK